MVIYEASIPGLQNSISSMLLLGAVALGIQHSISGLSLLETFAAELGGLGTPHMSSICVTPSPDNSPTSVSTDRSSGVSREDYDHKCRLEEVAILASSEV